MRSDRKARRRAAEGPSGPLVLGLETGGDHLGLALLRLDATAGCAGAVVLDALVEHRAHRHAEALLEVLEAMLQRNKAAPGDLGLLAVGRGPGGFTGVRVGMATALGVALGAKIPLWPVDALAALALHAAVPGGPLCAPLIDAKKGEVYGALFEPRPDGTLAPLLPAAVGPHATLLARFAAAAGPRPFTVFGSGAVAFGCASPVPLGWHVASPVHVAELGARAWDAAGRPAEGPPVDPAYVRPSDAEIAHGLPARG